MVWVCLPQSVDKVVGNTLLGGLPSPSNPSTGNIRKLHSGQEKKELRELPAPTLISKGQDLSLACCWDMALDSAAEDALLISHDPSWGDNHHVWSLMCQNKTMVADGYCDKGL